MPITGHGALSWGPEHYEPLKIEPALLAASVYARQMPGNVAFREMAFARMTISGVVPVLVLHDDKRQLVDIGKGAVPVMRFTEEGSVVGHLAPFYR